MKNDIGNIYPFLHDYISGRKRGLSWLSGGWKDTGDWKAAARTRIGELLGYVPQPAPLDAAVTGVVERPEYIVEDVEFNTARHTRVKGSLLIPKTKGKAEKFPALVALHDHSGVYYFGREKLIEQRAEPPFLQKFKQSVYGGRSWAGEAAKRGYVVLCIDSFYFGSRKLDIETLSEDIMERCPHKLKGLEPGTDAYIRTYNEICLFAESLVVKHILAAGMTWPGILVHDDMKSVDYLCSRSEVDIARIGCCGLSLGAYRAVFLAGLDDRIRCSVVAGWMSTYDSLQWNRLRDHTFMLFVPLLAGQMDLADIASLTAPNPLFVQQCARDTLFHPEGMREAVDRIRDVYAGMGHPEAFRASFYDNGHQFHAGMQEDAFSWFDRWLK